MTCLHHAWDVTGGPKNERLGPRLLKELGSLGTGITLCNRRGVPRDEMTSFVDDCTCRDCLVKAGCEGLPNEEVPNETPTKAEAPRVDEQPTPHPEEPGGSDPGRTDCEASGTL